MVGIDGCVVCVSHLSTLAIYHQYVTPWTEGGGGLFPSPSPPPFRLVGWGRGWGTIPHPLPSSL